MLQKACAWSGNPVSQLVQNQRDAACQQVAGRLAGIDLDQVHREGDVVGAQDEAIGEEIHIAQRQVGAMADGVKVGPVGALGRERNVVAIQQHNGLRHHQRLHR